MVESATSTACSTASLRTWVASTWLHLYLLGSQDFGVATSTILFFQIISDLINQFVDLLQSAEATRSFISLSSMLSIASSMLSPMKSSLSMLILRRLTMLETSFMSVSPFNLTSKELNPWILLAKVMSV
jgi:hypothetical protein